jgi:hypothetical protein
MGHAIVIVCRVGFRVQFRKFYPSEQNSTPSLPTCYLLLLESHIGGRDIPVGVGSSACSRHGCGVGD